MNSEQRASIRNNAAKAVQILEHSPVRILESSALLNRIGGNLGLMTKNQTRFVLTSVFAALIGSGVFAALPAQAQRKTITLDELVVEGNIQKPEAFFILPRTSLNFDGLERRADLKSKILESVQQQPF